MSAFTVRKTNAASKAPLRRGDINMTHQMNLAQDRAKIALYEANLAAFELTTATRTTHSKFLLALLGEVKNFRQAKGLSTRSTDIAELLQQHEGLLKAYPDRDIYGQSVALVAHQRVFN